MNTLKYHVDQGQLNKTQEENLWKAYEKWNTKLYDLLDKDFDWQM